MRACQRDIETKQEELPKQSCKKWATTIKNITDYDIKYKNGNISTLILNKYKWETIDKYPL
jgi:hypothetical protein